VTVVLLSSRALDALGDRIDAIPDVTPMVLTDHVEGFDAAWLSGDLFTHRDDLVRFFGACASSDTLRWLQTSNAGVDHPVFKSIADRGVTLTTSHVTGPPIAEYVLRAVLDHFQRAGEWRSTIAERQWATHEYREVLGTTWLVVGLGAIGTAVAERARAFGATVLGVRRTPTGDEPVDELVGLDAVGRADVIVLAAPATAATRGMVDAAFLASMKPGSVLVNVARGSLVNEDALVAALDAGAGIDAALLDVTATEPLPDDSPLWSHPKVVLTPHSSALGHGRHARAADVFVANLARYVAGEPLHGVEQL
jgi:phosphoglycerate dehydrogenase-like enzyme